MEDNTDGQFSGWEGTIRRMGDGLGVRPAIVYTGGNVTLLGVNLEGGGSLLMGPCEWDGLTQDPTEVESDAWCIGFYDDSLGYCGAAEVSGTTPEAIGEALRELLADEPLRLS